ncbi:hypothetical protein BH24ACT3_BH24ACT3_01960 [soil metagenome]
MTATLRRTLLDPRSAASALRRADRLWLLPFAVAGIVLLTTPAGLAVATGALLTLGLALLTASAPRQGVLVLLAALPHQTFLFSGLHRIGVPEPLVRNGGYWKEAVVIGLALHAVRHWWAEERRLDTLDVVALLYVAFVTLYLAFPQLFVVATATGTGGPPTDVLVRTLAYRADVAFVVLLLVGRHAGFDRAFLHRAGRVLLGSAAIVATLGLFEFVATPAWNALTVDVLRVPQFQFEVFGGVNRRLVDVLNVGAVGGPGSSLRIGSVFLSPLPLGFYLLAPLAIGLEQVVRRTAPVWVHLSTGLIALCLLLTQTRSAVLGGLVIGVWALRRAPGRTSGTRLRVALLGAAALVMLVPTATSTGLGERTSAAFAGEDESTADHLRGLTTGLELLTDEPLGRGLGTAAGIGQRFEVPGTVVPENYYLQVGNEVGVHAMVAFIALGLLLVLRLGRASRFGLGSHASALQGCAVALAVGCMFLHVFANLAVAWPVWLLAGMASAPSRHEVAGSDSPRPGPSSRVTAQQAAGR